MASQAGTSASMRLSILGCGDAFGSGGRLQPCFHIQLAETQLLVDCGATALIGLKRLGIDANGVGTIVLSHLHGDHYAGLVWWILHAKHVSGRRAPLTIIGPEGTEARYLATAELLYPGSTAIVPDFELRFESHRDGVGLAASGFTVTPFAVNHPSGALSAALRIEAAGKVLAYSGDTEWVERLRDCAAGADLYISECSGLEGPTYYHMAWETIRPKLDGLGAKRILLTHMNDEMLAYAEGLANDRLLVAQDGMILDI